MKRIVSIALCMVLMVSLCTGCCFNHQYTSTVTLEPTYKAVGERTYTCSKCGDTYTEEIEKLEKHVVSKAVLDDALANARVYYSVFSISVGELVNTAMENYKIVYMTGEEAIEKGYFTRSDIDKSVNIDNLYYAIISGETMKNPDFPYMLEYKEIALEALLLFDDNDELINHHITLCDNLETCCILLMTSGY